MKTYSIHDQAAMDMLQERRDHSLPPEYWDDYREYDPEPEEDDNGHPGRTGGKNLLKIGRFEPSSRTCDACGTVNRDEAKKAKENGV